VLADSLGRPVDVFGRPQLHSPLFSLLRLMPGLFKRVPPSFYQRHEGAVNVACPCGAAYRGLRVPVGTPTPCEGCGRSYVATDRGVFAAAGMTEAEWQAHCAEPLEAA
jgi:hypothetical protein